MMKHWRVVMGLAVVVLGGTVGAWGEQAVDEAGKPGVVEVREFVARGQAVEVEVTGGAGAGVELLLLDFVGRATSARSEGVVSGRVDLAKLFAKPLSTPGSYVLFAVAPGGDESNFVGTPLVVEVREDRRRGAPSGPMFFKMEPLRYAAVNTTAGEMKVCFYHDTAPVTVSAIQRLMEGGFYNGLEFFRVEAGFVVQTGDPRNDGTGGPGFTTPAEFSDRQHLPGVLSMARLTDPNEAPGLLPRPEFANSGGSQFFISLDYASTKQLDRRFTAFGRVVEGMDAVKAIAALPRADKSTRPLQPAKVISTKLVPVTAGDNPYAKLRVVETSAAEPEVGATTNPGR